MAAAYSCSHPACQHTGSRCQPAQRSIRRLTRDHPVATALSLSRGSARANVPEKIAYARLTERTSHAQVALHGRWHELQILFGDDRIEQLRAAELCGGRFRFRIRMCEAPRPFRRADADKTAKLHNQPLLAAALSRSVRRLRLPHTHVALAHLQRHGADNSQFMTNPTSACEDGCPSSGTRRLTP